MNASATTPREFASRAPIPVTGEFRSIGNGNFARTAPPRHGASLILAFTVALILGCGRGGRDISLTLLTASSPGAQVLPVGRDVRVVTPRKPWARGAAVSLANLSGRETRVKLTIDLKVTEGTVGVGLLNAEGTRFLDEEFVNPSPDYAQVSLFVDSLNDTSGLVLRNASIDGTASDALVRNMSLQPQPSTGASEPSTGTHPWFKKYLEAQIPELRDPSFTDWQKINAIRQWTYNNVPVAFGPGVALDEKYGYAVYDFDPQDILFLLSSDAGGYYCAGTAEFLATIYRVFGYESYTYNMGQPEGPSSHVTTLVRFSYSGKQVTTVQDAFFNFRLMRNGEPLEFEELLLALGRDEAARIEFQTGNTDCKPAVSLPAETEQYRTAYKGKMGPITFLNQNARFCHDLSLQTFSALGEYEHWLDERVGRNNFLYLFLFPISTSGESEVEALAREAKQIQKRLLVGSVTR